MNRLPLSFVAEAKVLAYDASPRTSAGSLPLAPVASLSDAELLERLLDPPSKARPDPLAIAERLLGGAPSARGLAELLDLAPEHLAPLGLSAEAVSRLLAALEIGRRLAWGEVPEEQPLTDPAAVARHLFLRYASAHQEVMGAVLLDLRNRWLADFEIARGTLDRVSVEPRQALVEALRRGAAGIILFHNHPGGDPSPSGEDYEFTRRFTQAAEIVGIKLIDHLVLGGTTRWCSIRDRRPW
ncbi:MAG TPA: DNA repair protein RadC [Thermoanaerobaculia bacterium]|jgi:DNA repair protein RadC|nr:DNA repair protein RadC [Thermoanaerobaculia bacterium]